jgi:hypothetical protein
MRDGMSLLPGGKNRPMPIDIKIGRAEAALPCEACKKMSPSGFFVIAGGAVIMLCMSCVGRAIVRHQELNPMEKLIELDVNVQEDDYKRAAEAVRTKMPELTEDKAYDIARVAIDAI